MRTRNDIGGGGDGGSLCNGEHRGGIWSLDTGAGACPGGGYAIGQLLEIQFLVIS